MFFISAVKKPKIITNIIRKSSLRQHVFQTDSRIQSVQKYAQIEGLQKSILTQSVRENS